MPDPIFDPPAIVQPAIDPFAQIDAQRLHALMSAAQAFGRKTIEQAVAAGNKLIEAMTEIDQQNALIKLRKNKIQKKEVLKRYGYSPETAYRIMRKARSHNSRVKLTHELDAIYDDGIPPDDDPDKKPCRECRMRGKKYDRNCAACRALNRPIPKPTVNGPLVDGDGHPVPEHLIPVWNDAETIKSFNTQILAAAKAIKGIAQRPCGRGVPADHFLGRLKGLLNSNYAYRPGFVCQDCQGHGCEKCDGDGWFPDATIRQQRAEAKAKERREERERQHQPLPE